MRAARSSPTCSPPRPVLRAAVFALALLVLASLPAMLPADPVAGQKDFDARQKLYLRRAFNDDHDSGLATCASDVWVEVRGNVVILSGQVPSAILKQRALYLASQLKGITEVKGDDLQVVPREGESDLASPFVEGTPPRGTLADNPHDGHKTDLPETARPPLNEAVTLLPPVAQARPAVEILQPRPLQAESDLPAAVEALRRKDERFRRVTVEVRQKTVYLRGTVVRWADANDLTNAVRRLPGVEAVIVDDVRVDAGAGRR